MDTALWTAAQLVRGDLRSRRLLRQAGLLQALVEIMRAGDIVYGEHAIQLAAETVLAFVKTDVEACSMLFDYGIVRCAAGMAATGAMLVMGSYLRAELSLLSCPL